MFFNNFQLARKFLVYFSLCGLSNGGVFIDESSPSYVPKLYVNNLAVKNKKTQYIIKNKIVSEIIYSMLCAKNNSDPMEITQYLYDRYTHLAVGEKSLLYTMLILGNDPSNKNMIMDLQKKINTAYPESYYIWLGTFLLSFYFLINLSDKPVENYEAIQEAVECIILTKEEIFNRNKKYNILIFFIAQYYLCEYFLNMAVYAFNAKRYNEVIMYCKKILLRHKIHPIAALEALFYLLEVMLILNFKELSIYYKSILERHIRDNPLLQKHKYDRRLAYLLQVYGFTFSE